MSWRLAQRSLNLFVPLVADEDNLVIALRESPSLAMDLGDQWARGVDGPQVALGGVAMHLWGHAMRTEHNDLALRHLVGLVDEYCAPLLELCDNVHVMNNLLADIDRGAVGLQGLLDGLDRTIDPRAVSAGFGQQNSFLSHATIVSDPGRRRAWRQNGAVTDTVKPGSDAEHPFSVHHISTVIGDYLARLGTAWVEGQVAELRETRALTYLKLRDTERDETISIHIATSDLAAVSPPVAQGSRLVIQAKVAWWPKKGELQFKVLQMRAVGLGELMARLAALRDTLAAEGLFAQARKQSLPFLPRRIGLICGQNSDAMHDVIQNAKRRWPDADFVVREVPVQGPTAVRSVMTVLSELDAIDDVDVIVITRGGGSFEDLLPFSDETLVRAVAQAVTPVVAAIGHEQDRPLIDYVADYRASTPTDAARAIVPDVIHEQAALRNARAIMWQLVQRRLTDAAADLERVRSRPALAAPHVLVDQRAALVAGLRASAVQRLTMSLDMRAAELAGSRSTLRALSPQGTLDRGYAIVRDGAGRVVRSTQQAPSGTTLRITVADGDISATTD